ncbi:MAG TPA: methyltransferase domain-containing protein [Pyrinomonadaceae bacterium]|jgi:2-polyprenyl-3-methyl-5-hydroxy-6-metoxy-1,4-benzoquinol methylase
MDNNKERHRSTSQRIEQAITAMLEEYSDNDWMLNDHWPIIEPHVRLMVADVMNRFPPASHARLLDVGCFNGYLSLLFKQLGYDVVGTDACELEDRQAVFAKAGIEFMYANLNELEPFAQPTIKPFDIIIIAQVIEHILNHPLGLLRSLMQIMRPGGIMILTTPNPVTVMGALRVLTGRSSLWGTNDFILEPKINAGRIITKADIHYREYTDAELRYMINGAGLQVEHHRYLSLGESKTQPPLKKFIKKNPLTQKLMTKRLFGSNHYVLARKPELKSPPVILS